MKALVLCKSYFKIGKREELEINIFLKNGPILASFWLFSSFSHYNFNNRN